MITNLCAFIDVKEPKFILVNGSNNEAIFYQVVQDNPDIPIHAKRLVGANGYYRLPDNQDVELIVRSAVAGYLKSESIVC